MPGRRYRSHGGRNDLRVLHRRSKAVRDQLVQDGRLVDGPSPELYRFAMDVPFASPSAAASIVAARSASGPREWRLRGSGQCYRDWRAERLGES
jgi:hypothetical protein